MYRQFIIISNRRSSAREPKRGTQTGNQDREPRRERNTGNQDGEGTKKDKDGERKNEKKINPVSAF